MACLASALADPYQTDSTLHWLARPDLPQSGLGLPPLDHLEPNAVEVRTLHSKSGPSPEPHDSRLQISDEHWTVQRPDGSVQEGSGDVAAFLDWAKDHLDRTDIVVTPSDDLSAGRTLAIAGALSSGGARIFLEPARKPKAPREAKHRGSVELGKPSVSGVVDLAKVTDTVTSRRARIEACYEDGLARSPELGGPLIIRFSLQQDGNVSQAKSGTPSFADSKTADCIVDIFESTAFVAPVGGGATVFFPLILTPGQKHENGGSDGMPADAGVTRNTEITFEKVTVSGMLLPTEIQARIEKLRPTVAACADRASEAIDGRVEVHFTIGPRGGVTNVEKDPDSTLPSGVTGCIYGALYQIGFPTPTEASVKVSAPIRIRRVP